MKNFIRPLTLLSSVTVLLFIACNKESKLNQEFVTIDTPVTELTERKCISHEIFDQMMKEDPQFRANQNALEDYTTRFIAQPDLQNRNIKTIAVVVHVLWNTPSENISDAQIYSQIDILNKDFSNTNSESGSVPAPFTNVVGNAGIQFTLSPNDIIRRQTNKKKFPLNNIMKYTNKGGSDAVEPTKKLNIWVCTIDKNILGFAYYPGTTSIETDGVVVLNTAFGDIGTAAPPFHKGRTATHEIGHWLNLIHIWGDADCGTDLVADTPQHNTPNFGCPEPNHTSTCINTPIEMTMNYMDYSDDLCMYMFSKGQASRMQAALSSTRAGFVR